MNYPGEKLTVCVTGAGGYIGSWLVKTLLQTGYTVHATLRDPGNTDKSSCLLALPGANERLCLFQADLAHEGSFDAAIHGCQGVFHVATPTDFASKDPENEIIEPAIRGTLNVLNSCVRAKSVKRVVYTSSVGAACYTETLKDPIDESCWSSVDFLRNNKSLGWFYSLSKTLSEKAALQFGRENRIEVVSIVLTIAAGPWITKAVPSSVETAMSLITGNQQGIEFLKSCLLAWKFMWVAHIEDVCNAHVYLMERPVVEDRYICSARNVTVSEMADVVSKRYPQYYNITRFGDLASASGGAPAIGVSASGGAPAIGVSSKKLLDLGFLYKHGLDEIIDDSIQCFQKLGFLA